MIKLENPTALITPANHIFLNKISPTIPSIILYAGKTNNTTKAIIPSADHPVVSCPFLKYSQNANKRYNNKNLRI